MCEEENGLIKKKVKPLQLTFDQMLKKLSFMMLSEELQHLTCAHIKFYSLRRMTLILNFTNVVKTKLCHALMLSLCYNKFREFI